MLGIEVIFEQATLTYACQDCLSESSTETF